MNVPGGIGHDNIELAQHLEVKVAQVAVNPLGVLHALPYYFLLLCQLPLLVLLHIVYELAVRVMTGVQVRTVPERFVRILVYNGSKVLFGAVAMALGPLAPFASAMVAVLDVLLGLKLQRFHLLLKAADILNLPQLGSTSASMSIFSPKSEGWFSRL